MKKIIKTTVVLSMVASASLMATTSVNSVFYNGDNSTGTWMVNYKPSDSSDAEKTRILVDNKVDRVVSHKDRDSRTVGLNSNPENDVCHTLVIETLDESGDVIEKSSEKTFARTTLRGEVSCDSHWLTQSSQQPTEPEEDDEDENTMGVDVYWGVSDHRWIVNYAVPDLSDAEEDRIIIDGKVNRTVGHVYKYENYKRDLLTLDSNRYEDSCHSLKMEVLNKSNKVVESSEAVLFGNLAKCDESTDLENIITEMPTHSDMELIIDDKEVHNIASFFPSTNKNAKKDRILVNGKTNLVVNHKNSDTRRRYELEYGDYDMNGCNSVQVEVLDASDKVIESSNVYYFGDTRTCKENQVLNALPVITIKGSDPLKVSSVEEIYKHADVTAADKEDGDITDKIVVDTTKYDNTYHVVYRVRDSIGLDAVNGSYRTIIVEDKSSDNNSFKEDNLELYRNTDNWYIGFSYEGDVSKLSSYRMVNTANNEVVRTISSDHLRSHYKASLKPVTEDFLEIEIQAIEKDTGKVVARGKISRTY